MSDFISWTEFCELFESLQTENVIFLGSILDLLGSSNVRKHPVSNDLLYAENLRDIIRNRLKTEVASDNHFGGSIQSSRKRWRCRGKYGRKRRALRTRVSLSENPSDLPQHDSSVEHVSKMCSNNICQSIPEGASLNAECYSASKVHKGSNCSQKKLVVFHQMIVRAQRFVDYFEKRSNFLDDKVESAFVCLKNLILEGWMGFLSQHIFAKKFKKIRGVITAFQRKKFNSVKKKVVKIVVSNPIDQGSAFIDVEKKKNSLKRIEPVYHECFDVSHQYFVEGSIESPGLPWIQVLSKKKQKNVSKVPKQTIQKKIRPVHLKDDQQFLAEFASGVIDSQSNLDVSVPCARTESSIFAHLDKSKIEKSQSYANSYADIDHFPNLPSSRDFSVSCSVNNASVCFGFQNSRSNAKSYSDIVKSCNWNHESLIFKVRNFDHFEKKSCSESVLKAFNSVHFERSAIHDQNSLFCPDSFEEKSLSYIGGGPVKRPQGFHCFKDVKKSKTHVPIKMSMMQRVDSFKTSQCVEIINVAGDGDCQYHAVKAALNAAGYDCDITSSDLRSLVKNLLLEHIQENSPFYVERGTSSSLGGLFYQAFQNEKSKGESWENFKTRYLNGISSDSNEYGDFVTLNLLAEYFKVRIRVFIANLENDQISYSVHSGKYQSNGEKGSLLGTINLLLLEKHYQVVIPQEHCSFFLEYCNLKSNLENSNEPIVFISEVPSSPPEPFDISQNENFNLEEPILNSDVCADQNDDCEILFEGSPGFQDNIKDDNSKDCNKFSKLFPEKDVDKNPFPDIEFLFAATPSQNCAVAHSQSTHISSSQCLDDLNPSKVQAIDFEYKDEMFYKKKIFGFKLFKSSFMEKCLRGPRLVDKFKPKHLHLAHFPNIASISSDKEVFKLINSFEVRNDLCYVKDSSFENCLEFFQSCLKAVNYPIQFDRDCIKILIMSWIVSLVSKKQFKSEIKNELRNCYINQIGSSSQEFVWKENGQKILEYLNELHYLIDLNLQAFSDMFRIRFRYFSVFKNSNGDYEQNSEFINGNQSHWPLLNVAHTESFDKFDEFNNPKQILLLYKSLHDKKMYSSLSQNASNFVLFNPKKLVKGRIIRLKKKSLKNQENLVNCKSQEKQEKNDFNFFDHLPSIESVQKCMQSYLENSSDSSLSFDICCVCSERIPKFEQNSTFQVSFDKFSRALHVLARGSYLEDIQCQKAFPIHEVIEDFSLFDYKNFFLDSYGINDQRFVENEFLSFNVCKGCFGPLFPSSKNSISKLPAASLANDNELCDIPDILKDLTPVEQILISPIRTIMSVIKLTDMGGFRAHRGLKGNCIAFPQEVPHLEKLLPRSIGSISDLLQIVFVGKQISTDQLRISLKRIATVNRSRVEAAILEINKYRGSLGLCLSQVNLDELPENDIPDIILKNVHFISDENLIKADAGEREGYANLPDDENENLNSEKEPDNDDIEFMNFGIIDQNCKGVNADEISNAAIRNVIKNINANLDSINNASVNDSNQHGSTQHDINKAIGVDGQQGNGYLILPRKSEPVSEFNNPYLFPDGFVTLFPDRKGGPYKIDPPRKVKFSFLSWCRHVLNIRDDRFRKHYSFLFYISNILKRKDTCFHSRLKLKSSSIIADGKAFDSIRKYSKVDFVKAVELFNSKKVISDPNLKHIVNLLSVSGSKINSHVLSKLNMRHEIMSLFLYHGLPRIFLTINPNDFESKLVSYYSGLTSEINCKPGFVPKRFARRLAATQDPVACAIFFKTVISGIIKYLLGFDLKCPTKGVLGYVKDYYGVVEAQGRGTLHFHSLVWLDGFPNSKELQEKIQSAEFREKFKNYLDFIISTFAKSDSVIENGINEVDEEHEKCDSPHNNEINVAFDDFPSLPFPSDFVKAFYDSVGEDANKFQKHRCTRTCRKFKKGEEKCRFGFSEGGKELVSETKVYEDGSFEIKREDPFINNYNPAILSCIKSNNDIKFIGTAKDSRALSFYITHYITKNTASSTNMISVLGMICDNLLKHPLQFGNDDIESLDSKTTVKLLNKCLNKMNILGEVSGPEAAAHVLGHPDHYCGGKFGKIFVGSFKKEMNIFEDESKDNTTDESDTFQIKFNSVTGEVCPNNQKQDYLFRHEELCNVSLYEFVSDYVLMPCRHKKIDDSKIFIFPRSKHWRFKTEHPLFESHYIAKRRTPVCPSLLQLPPSVEKNPETYSQMVLLLFVPFEANVLNEKGKDLNWVQQLSGNHTSWFEAFKFQENSGLFNKSVSKYLNNLLEVQGAMEQHIADIEIAKQKVLNTKIAELQNQHVQLCKEDFPIFENADDLLDMQFQIDAERDLKQGDQNAEFSHLTKALESIAGQDFPQSSNFPKDKPCGMKFHASTIKNWVDSLNDQNKKAANEIIGCIDSDVETNNLDQNNSEDNNKNASVKPYLLKFGSTEFDKVRLEIIKEEKLNKEQARAFSIVCDQLIQTVISENSNSKPPDPLLMTILGEGGTGKSRIIHCIKDFFNKIGKESWLRISASTGKAAKLLNGCTLHSVINYQFASVDKDKKDVASNIGFQSLIKKWKLPKFWIIDEISMVGCKLFSQMYSALIHAKENSLLCDPFGGINVILLGDFFQFKPVLDIPLFADLDYVIAKNEKFKSQSSLEAKVGLTNFLTHFSKFVILKQQVRAASDPEYQSLLGRSRSGKCNIEDINFLKSKIERKIGIPDIFHTTIIVHDNASRKILNELLVLKYAKFYNKPIYSICSQLIFENQEIKNIRENLIKKIILYPGSKFGGIESKLYLVKGAPVVINFNIASAIGITNGTPGILYDFILNDEEDLKMCKKGVDGDILLQHLPKCLIIKFDETVKFQHSDFEQFSSNTAPIIPKSSTIFESIKTKKALKSTIAESHVGKTGQFSKASLNKEKNSANMKMNDSIDVKVKRVGFPISLNFCSTAHKCQGETLNSAIIDLQIDKKFANTATTYVPLSRLKNSAGLCILRDFDPSILKLTISKQLEDFMEKAELSDRATEKQYEHLSKSSFH